MNKLILTAALYLLLPRIGLSQAVFNNGSVLQIQPGATLFVNGGVTNQSGSDLRNNGTLEVKGDLTNHQVMNALYTGRLILSGTSAQTHGGSSAFLTNALTINNANQINNNNTITVNAECKFINGIFNAPSTSAPLRFAQNGFVSVSNPPSNASHVNGYVMRNGTGSFTYPVGDGSRYQPVTANLSSNPNGMRVRYIAGDAGAATMSSGGTESTPLLSYNPQEYWDFTPQTVATGTVTVFWDNYRNPAITYVALQKVAHKFFTSWLNEGTIAGGTTSAGSVTSNSVSGWGPFTLGEVCAVPIMNTTASNSSICNGQSTTLTASGATSYTWQPGNLSGASIVVSPNTTTTYTVTGTVAGGCTNSSTRVITVSPCNTIVNLKAYIEGYYSGAGFMRPVLLNQGVAGATATQTDSISVELRSAIPPYPAVSSVQTMLNTDGTATCSFTQTGSYYLVLKHRNALQTWSAGLINLNGGTFNYDFTDAPGKAYGANQSGLGGGYYGLYSGDINADENIDLTDLSEQEADINNFISGYYSTDLNGDGNVDILDSPVLETNINNFQFSVHP